MFEGSNPSLSTIYGSVAQVVEQETENLRVGSANLSRTTKITCSSGGTGRRTGLVEYPVIIGKGSTYIQHQKSRV